MAAKKSSGRRADKRNPSARQRRTSHSRRGSAGKPLAPCSYERTNGKSTERAALNRAEVIRLLAEALALQRTIGMAMQEFADHPTFGSICVAFTQGVEALSRAHSEVGRLLERRTA